MVFYRKYRPQHIDDLDSESVRETLYAILQKDISHAFLFTGPKGLGKTSTARIVAKVVNCTTDKKKRKQEIEPCGECDQCVSITNGTNVDVLEIDAASNRGIDEIRELKEKIRLASVAAKRKVYIIDEVHMLTTEAFNALLKTLEEPPEHAMFILCTTESHKVPETIVSRCFQLQFKPATEEELVRSFKRIVDGEKLKIDNDALHYIAQLSDRGFRDGVKILEEVSLLAKGEDIDKKFIEKTYKTVATINNLLNFIVFLQERDVKKSLEVIQTVVNQGEDVKYFTTKVLELLHDILLHNLNLGEDNKTLFGTLKLKNNEVIMLVELFSQAYTDMKYAVLLQLPLEIAVITWCEDSRNHTEQNAEPRHVEQQAQFVQRGSVSSSASVSDLRKQVGTMKKLKAMYGPSKEDTTPKESISVTTASVELLQTAGDGPVTTEWMELFWKCLIDEMKKHNHTVAGVLRGCTVKSYENQQLIIQTAYKFHKERLEDMKNHDSLIKISKLLTGKDVAITIELRKN